MKNHIVIHRRKNTSIGLCFRAKTNRNIAYVVNALIMLHLSVEHKKSTENQYNFQHLNIICEIVLQTDN